MNKKHIGLLVLILSLILTMGCKKKEPISRTEFLMDTIMTIKIYDKGNDKVLDKAFDRLREIEERMSVTIETSDINKINKMAGIEAVTVNEDTYFVIKEAKHYAELSKGAYDPTIGPLVDLWDIKSEEKERNTIPSNEEIEEKRSLVNYECLELLDNNQVYLQKEDMKLNLGGIVKGYAADEMKRILKENGVNIAIIDLGGNLYAYGEKLDKTPWRIGIQNPFEVTGLHLGIVEVRDKSIVTSGDYERFFNYQGNIYHHILDASTGYPVDNQLRGVSIISDKSIDGDALSTTLFVLGLDDGMELVKKLNGVEAIFITKDKEIYRTDNLTDEFTLQSGDKSFIIKEYDISVKNY